MDQNRQRIISISREFGSGGHSIAEAIATRFDLPFYDSNLLDHIAEEKEVSVEPLKKYDEKSRYRLFSRTVQGFSNSMQENIAQMQFEYLRRMAQEGKSFVIVGRCSEYILREYPGLISIFVMGKKQAKVERIMRIYNLSEDEARKFEARKDRERKSYHNYYCDGKWGDSRNYDLCISSTGLGTEKTADIIEAFIKAHSGE